MPLRYLKWLHLKMVHFKLCIFYNKKIKVYPAFVCIGALFLINSTVILKSSKLVKGVKHTTRNVLEHLSPAQVRVSFFDLRQSLGLQVAGQVLLEWAQGRDSKKGWCRSMGSVMEMYENIFGCWSGWVDYRNIGSDPINEALCCVLHNFLMTLQTLLLLKKKCS